ncbi:catalase family peroxidase [Alteromonas sediminis]|uniref:Catalase-related peroxidase n=1 Tax=Alteromonas sediminis TaxID=2259342 RepID=A0A3N5Z7N3_9ALTE|nr:catalase family peroxidase [Alteromonas sediminis]RPJ66724.1 catalase family peroxidase [Alteromonas sediminis]
MRISAIAFAVASGVLLANTAPIHAEQRVQATDFIALFEKLSGKQPGERKAHATGVCASGRFEPNTKVDIFTNAPLLSNGNLPATIRFSLGGGNPAADERVPGTRGMGVQISLPDGTRHMFTGNNFPVFAGKDPDTFFGFLSTLLPDENGNRDPQKTMEFVKNNPSVQANLAWNQQAKTASSYGNTEFFGLHTFFYNGNNDQVMFRWHITPDLGVKTLDAEQANAMSNPFLADRLAEQLNDGTVSYTLSAIIGEDGDAVIDPSVQWPEDRKKVVLGKLVLEQSGGDGCTPVNFDPNIMSAGFSPSDDPVLKMRSLAYAVSFGKRLSGQ